MNTRHAKMALTFALLLVYATAAAAQPQMPPDGGGSVTTFPASSIPDIGDAGQRAHTNLQILVPAEGVSGTPEVYGPPVSGLLYQTPASIACIYRLQPAVAGCNPNIAYMNPQGGRKALAIVDAYDNPNAFADLQTFSAQFGLAAINPTSFIVVFAPHGGPTPGSCVGPATRPPSAKGTGWDLEEALDIEWAHAMAPLATLYLVEAQSNSFSDLNCAVSVASQIVAAAGGGQISMSWGSSEFAAEVANDAVFTTPRVVYFASSGDWPGVSYPSASPNVVSVGGTSLSFDATTGTFKRETTWQSTGGGLQCGRTTTQLPGRHRGPGWHAPGHARHRLRREPVYRRLGLRQSDARRAARGTFVGGTSVSSPTWAGIVNAAGGFAASTAAELTKLYDDPDRNFTDIASGVCGLYMGLSAVKDWDPCSGLGSPKKYGGK